MNSAMSPWLKSQLSCSFRSSPREPKKPRSSSPPTCPSPSGHRSSPTHGSARLCSTGSPTRPTSSRPVQSPIASAEPCARRPRTKPGYSILLPLRPSGYAPAEPNTRNINVPGGGPNQVAKVISDPEDLLIPFCGNFRFPGRELSPFHGNKSLALIPITNTPTAAESKFGPQFVLLIFIGNLDHCIGHVAVVDECGGPSHTSPIAVIRNARRSGHQNIGAPR